jgi:hypothetical protein
MGIEPTSEAWEALNITLKAIDLAALSFLNDGLNWRDGNRNGHPAQIKRFPFAVNLSGMRSVRHLASRRSRLFLENPSKLPPVDSRFPVWLDGKATDSYHLVCIVQEPWQYD